MTETALRPPVLVLTCNRVLHLTRLVESLRGCVGANETELHIAIDAPFNPSVIQANDEIIRYSESVTGFARVHLHRRANNVGPNTNLGLAVEDIFRTHDSLILLEDDNIVSGNFLSFMSATMSKFRRNPRCFSVCGYNVPVARPEKCVTDIYCSPIVNAWGIGFFRERYLRPDLEAKKELDCFFLNPLNLVRAHLLSPPLFALFIYMHMSRQEFPDVLFSIHALKNAMFNVRPVDTKVMNLGFDGSGVHCDQSDAYSHDVFVNADRNTFALDLDERTNRHYIRLGRKRVTLSWRASLSAYLTYILCLVLGRDTSIELRKWLKANLQRVGNRG